MDIYEPAEDSYLLADAVKKYARGKVLDMGTGSGIQAKTALGVKRVKSVVAVDVNKAAHRHIPRKVKFIHSDLFLNVKGKFDTIIFNPPYLPQDKGIKDIGLYGGKKGYETVDRFLHVVSEYLESRGTVLLLFSSLTNKEKVDGTIADNCLEKAELSRKSIGFFETLYVYRITKSKLLQQLERKGIRNVERFAEGNRGVIYTGSRNGKVAVKVKLPQSKAPNTIANEAKWLERANKKGIGPKLISSSKNFLIYEFVDGEYFKDFLEKADSREIRKALRDILQQCRTLDRMKVNKEEMLRPFTNVIVGVKVALIDFERCRTSENPKNVTQFCQFLANTKLRKKGIKVNRKRLLDAAKKYKNNQSDSNFRVISDEI